MTFEEIQQTIEQMLAVQRELQESQIKQTQEIQLLIEQSKQHQRNLDKHERILKLLVPNSIASFDLEERL